MDEKAMKSPVPQTGATTGGGTGAGPPPPEGELPPPPPDEPDTVEPPPAVDAGGVTTGAPPGPLTSTLVAGAWAAASLPTWAMWPTRSAEGPAGLAGLGEPPPQPARVIEPASISMVRLRLVMGECSFRGVR
ncbi:hypothetical protein D3C72_1534650 [compost metagenome]